MAAHEDFYAAIEEELEQQNRSTAELNRSLAELNRSTAELKNSVYSNNDETSKCFDRLNNQADSILEMLRVLSNQMKRTSPSEDEPEFSAMDPNPDDITAGADCDERSEPNMQKVEAITSKTPITGISSANTYAVRFEEAVDGRENVTESDPFSEVCNAFDEFTEATPIALLNEQENGHYAHNLFDECTQPFFVEQSVRIAGNVHKRGVVLPMFKESIVESAPIMESVCGKPVMNDDDHAHKVFDIGTDPSRVLQHSFSLLSLFGMEETNDSYPIKVDNKLFDYKLDDKMWLNELMMLIFDPGGVLVRFDVLPIVAVQSFLSSEYVGAVKGLIKGSPTPWFGMVTSILEVDLGKSFRESTTHRVLNHRVLNEMPKLTYVDSNKESYANDGSITSIHCVSFVFDSSNGLRYVEARGLFVPMSLNSKVPLSPNSVVMVCYCSIIARTCHLFDPGGGYLSLLANHDTLIDNCARNDESSMTNNMCVSIVEWGSKKACKPLMQLMVDYKCWTPRTSDSADIDKILVKFCVSSDSVLSRVTILPTQQNVRLIGNFFMVADTIELLAGETYNMAIVGNKLIKLSSQCGKSSVGKTFNQSCQQVQDSIQPAQPLIKKLQQLNEPVIKCSYVSFPDSFSVTLDPIMIWIVDFSGKNWVTKFNSVGNDSSAGKAREDFGSKIMSIGLDMSRRKEFNWVFLLTGLKCFLHYLSSISIFITKLQIFVWDPGQNIISIHILEDKDVVERVGKGMVLMDTTLLIRRYDHEVQKRCLVYHLQGRTVIYDNRKHVINDIVLQVEQCAEGLDEVSLSIANDKDRVFIYIFLRASTLLHPLTLSCKVEEIASIIHRDPSLNVAVENFVWDPGLIWVCFRFSTLRTRWLLRGRICHELTFYYKFYMYFRIMYLGVVTSFNYNVTSPKSVAI